MQRIAVALAILLFSVSVPAVCKQISIAFPGDPAVDALIIPSSSPMRFKGFSKEQVPVAEFAGRFVLSGEYHFGYLGWEDERPGDLSLYINPDPAVRSALPHWRKRGGPKHIYVSNWKDFARAVLPRDVVKKLKKMTLHSVHGHVAIVADRYAAWIECDSPNYSVKFLSVYRPKHAILSQEFTGFGCG